MPSTVIAFMDYDPERQKLRINFVSGKVYDYHKVPAEMIERMKKATSKGSFFNRFIRDQFEFTQIIE